MRRSDRRRASDCRWLLLLLLCIVRGCASWATCPRRLERANATPAHVKIDRPVHPSQTDSTLAQQVAEILAHGGALPFKVASKSLDLPELQGDPKDIALEKCRAAARAISGPVMTEDTSLCFAALGGLPGPYIKSFLAALGPEDLPKLLAGFDDKSAYAQCIFAYCDGPSAEPRLFVGRTEGHIVHARGPLSFGWDPVFEPAGFSETYAEMDSAVKNRISHRYLALDQLRTFLLAGS
jgi:inosine triphosphate pyrophosphatase